MTSITLNSGDIIDKDYTNKLNLPEFFSLGVWSLVAGSGGNAGGCIAFSLSFSAVSSFDGSELFAFSGDGGAK